MDRDSTLLPVAVMLLAAASGSAQTVGTSDYSDAHSLAVEMRRLEHSPGPLVLPPVWRIVTPGGVVFTIPAGPASSATIEDAHRWLASHAAQLEDYDRSPEAPANAAPALHRILNGPSFRLVETHHWWDPYRRRFNAWLANLLGRLFAAIGRSPVSGQFVFWGVLAGAIAWLAYWLATVSRTSVAGLGLTGTAAYGAMKRSENWIGAMERARRSSDYRRAIQCAYWAAVTRLQASSALPLGLALTPREYLRQATPSSIGPLRVLTASLETFWYGGASATAADVSTVVTSLQEIGWRIE